MKKHKKGTTVIHKDKLFEGVGTIVNYNKDSLLYTIITKDEEILAFHHSLIKVKRKMNKEKKYFLTDRDFRIDKMFEEKNWVSTNNIQDSDLIVFPGGADISPLIYNHAIHPKTVGISDFHDQKEITVYNTALKLKKPMIGICRGGQLLHALNGGYLYQDVDNHEAYNGHTTEYLGDTIRVSSSHHQMMADPTIGQVLMHSKISTKKQYSKRKNSTVFGACGYDIEAMYYPKTNQVSFQPHPEYNGFNSCKRAFFDIVDTLLEKRKNEKNI